MKYLGECEVFTLTIFWNKNFQHFWAENLWLAFCFCSTPWANNRGLSTAAKRGGGHEIIGVAKPKVTKATGLKSSRRQKLQATKAPGNKSPRRQEPQTTKEDLRLLIYRVDHKNVSTF